MFFQLDDQDIWFPDPSLAESDGLLAMGGDLRKERLQLAYENGIFPWYSEETPILWYAPHERFVLFPEQLKVSKSMRKIMKAATYSITHNKAFEKVIRHCAQIPRKEQSGTWITPEMQEAYINLHQDGLASSIEVWLGDQLCGGLYGVICGARGHVFCGESMFSLLPNTSKLAFISLCQLKQFELIDCQIDSAHLRSMGASTISRESYLKILQS